MRHCHGPCKRLLPYDAFGAGRVKGGTAPWCRDCRKAELQEKFRRANDAGLCTWFAGGACSNPQAPGSRYCAIHAHRYACWKRNHEAKRRDAARAGSCYICGEPAERFYCDRHKAEYAAKVREKRRAKRLREKSHAWLIGASGKNMKSSRDLR